jgi:hypothetical protein
MIRNLIYLDEPKMYSLSSQIFEGMTDHVLKRGGESKEETESQKGPNSILYTLTLISDNFQNVIDLQSLTICVFVLSVFSFCLSYSIYDRLSALESQGLIKWALLAIR